MKVNVTASVFRHCSFIHYWMHHKNDRILAISGFALWIDGVCYGVYSRARDAVRRYRSIETDDKTGKYHNHYQDQYLPAWIEAVESGELVSRITEYGKIASRFDYVA